MEFAWFAIESRTVVIENAIGDVRGLLYLCELDASTDSVYSTRWEIEDIAFVHFVPCKDFADGTVGYSLFVFLWGYLLLKACIEIGARFRIEDIPHLGFSEFVVLTLCHLIIRMHLNGEVLVSFNDLGEEWQLVVVSLRNLLSKDFLWSSAYYLCEVIACPCAILYL